MPGPKKNPENRLVGTRHRVEQLKKQPEPCPAPTRREGGPVSGSSRKCVVPSKGIEKEKGGEDFRSGDGVGPNLAPLWGGKSGA